MVTQPTFKIKVRAVTVVISESSRNQVLPFCKAIDSGELIQLAWSVRDSIQKKATVQIFGAFYFCLFHAA